MNPEIERIRKYYDDLPARILQIERCRQETSYIERKDTLQPSSQQEKN